MGNFNLTEYCLNENLRKRSEKVSFIFYDKNLNRVEFTYNEVWNTVRVYSDYITKLNFPKSSRIIVHLENSPEYVFSFLSIIASGLIAIPVSPMLTKDELSYIIENSEAAAIIQSENLFKLEHKIKEIPISQIKAHKTEAFFQTYQSKLEDPAYLIYTSGTTGYPKGVLHSQRSILGRKLICKHWIDLNEKDIVLHAGQLNWTYTMGVGVLDPWSQGACSVLADLQSYSNLDIWMDLIQKEKVTIFATVPGLYRKLLKYSHYKQHDLSSLRHCLSAGEALPAELREQWHRSTQKEIFEALGMSEVSTYISTSPNIPYKHNSPGKIQDGRKIAILPIESGIEPVAIGEVGYLSVHSSEYGLMLKYWDKENPKENFREDWFITGDLAHQDEEGYIYYHGRSDDIMNSFGYRVSPLEVEKVLSKHSLVGDVGVCELNKPDGVSVIAAFVVPTQEITISKLQQELSDYSQEHLAKYKNPREYHIVKELPRNKNGKLLRKKLAELTIL